MSIKKILLVITKSNWGGAQKYVYDIATALDKDRFNVKVITGGNGDMVQKLREKGISVMIIDDLDRDIDFKKDIKTGKELYKIFKEEKPDIVHLNSSKIGAIGSLSAKIAKVKNIIFTAHGYAFNEDRSFFSTLFIKIVYWITIILTDKTIAVSESIKDQVKNWPFIEDKITIIRNGISNEALYSKTNSRIHLSKIFPDISNKIKKIKSDKKELVWIGSVGELHHIKGLRYGIEGVSLLIKEIRKNTNQNIEILYTIIGSGEEKESLKKEISKLEIEDNIFLLGHIDNAKEYMKAFDIMLIPSISEGLCYVAMESGLANLPTVATNVGGIPEIIDDMKSGILVQPKKSRDIYHALEFLINHNKVQDEHAKALNHKIKKDFSIEKMLESTVEIYNKSTKPVR